MTDIQDLATFELTPQQKNLWSTADDQQKMLSCQWQISLNYSREQIQQAVDTVIQHHESLRHHYIEQPGLVYPQQAVSEDVQALCFTIDSQDNHHLLTLTLSPLSADLYSIGLIHQHLSQQLFAPYQALPEPEADYQQFSEWQQECLDPELADEDEYQAAQSLLQQAQRNSQSQQPLLDTLAFAKNEAGFDSAQKATLTLDSTMCQQLRHTAAQWEISVEALLLATSYLCQLVQSNQYQPCQRLAINVELNCRPFDELNTITGRLSKDCEISLEHYQDDSLSQIVQRLANQLEQYQQLSEYLPAADSRGKFLQSYLALESSLSSEQFKLIDISNAGACQVAFRLIDNQQQITATIETNQQHLELSQPLPQWQLWLERYQQMLLQLLENPEQSLNQCQRLTVKEQQLISQLQGANLDFTDEFNILAAINHYAENHGDNIAIVAADEQLNYRSLQQRIALLSHNIQAQLKQTNAKVAICLPRGAQYLVAMLSCIASGHSFVPLEANNNSADDKARLQTLISKIDPDLIITEHNDFAGFNSINPSALATQTLDKPYAELINPQAFDPNALAYIIYTSGTTGEPKGVQVSNGNLHNYSHSLCQHLQLNQPLRFACVSTLAADLGYSALFPTWLTGGSVHLIAMDVVTDEQRFGQYLQQQQIDVVKMVPSHLQTLINNALLLQQDISQLIPNKHLLLGGETFTLSLLEQLNEVKQQRNSEVQFHNHYGPSEATIGCFAVNLSAFDSQQLQDYNSVPVGKALANVKFAVVDENLNPLPLYSKGELIIAGAGVSQGYSNAREQDQQKFIHTDDSTINLGRAYRSGDKVMLHANGCVEFFGRIDNQVKLRGYRVELPAIEQQLTAIEGVDAACVKLYQSQSQDQQQKQARLVAWWTGADKLDEQSLTSHLLAQLPEYMCPTQWIKLPQMPLTANGKINRKIGANGLPDPAEVLAKQQTFLAPQTEQEQQLAQLWQQILGVEQVGREDNFFTLGGNSLIATQVVAKLRQVTGQAISLADLFDHPILSQQAAYLAQLDSEQVNHNPLIKVEQAGLHPLSYAQQRLWFLDQLNPDSGFYNVPAQIRFEQAVDLTAIENALNQLCQQHSALRLRFSLDEQNRPQQYLSDQPLRIEQVSDADPLLIASEPFDLLNHGLMRAHWLSEQNTLLITLHHIISDAWSTDLLLKQFSDAYQQKPLAQEQFSFIDHCHWQQQTETQALIANQLTYWQQQLKGAAQYVEVPNDNLRPEYQSYQGARVHANIKPATVKALDELCQQYQVSRFMLLATGFNLLLNHYSGQQDISIAIPVAGRNQVGLEHTVGLFLNTLVLRSDFSQVLTPLELLEQVKHNSLAMFDHQDLPFDRLIRELPINRATSYTPFNQVCLNVLNTPLGKSLDIAGAELVISENHTAKYDFEWIISETAEQQLDIIVEYNTSLFNGNTISQMADKFVELLSLLPQRTQVPIQQLLAPEAQSLTAQQQQMAHWRNQQLAQAIVINGHSIDNQQSVEQKLALTTVDQPQLIATIALALSSFSQKQDLFVLNWQDATLLIDLQAVRKEQLTVATWCEQIAEQLKLASLIRVDLSANNITPSLQVTISNNNDKTSDADIHINHTQQHSNLTLQNSDFNGLLNIVAWLNQQITQDSQQTVNQLQWLTPEQQQQLLTWGQGPEVIASNDLVTQFIQQAKTNPTAIALKAGSREISFDYLHQQSNRIANCLTKQGIGANHIVALTAAGIDWITIMLGIIKTGAAYLPLDIQLPEKRKQQIISDAKVELVLTPDHPLLIEANDHSSEDLTVNIDPQSPLYVLYTSGSTGEPKGAVVTHSGEQNLVSWYRQQYQIDSSDRLLIASSTSFDLTQKNLFVALTTGASLHFPVMVGFDADCIVECLQQSQITMVNCAPSAFYAILSVCDDLQMLNSLRYLLLGGEPIDLSRLNPWLSQSDCQLVNMYGPTECTDIATAYTLSADNTATEQPIPIGSASGGVALYVLDNHLKLLPQGMVGELYIGGAGVGLGYLNRPEKTAASFIDNPYHQAQGLSKQLYKSGDLVYIDHNQQLVFVGRNDHQVKHRGFRIELNAINECLQQHPQIISAACSLVEEQLVAFYQLRESSEESHVLTNQMLAEFVSERLPYYMVPQQWQHQAQMPLSKNGKLDLIRLVSEYQQQQNSPKSKNFIAPHGERQIWLAQLWQKLFDDNRINCAEIAQDSDFFTLGGHSLVATQLASRIRKETGLDVALTQLFEHSRLDEMSNMLEVLSHQTQQTAITAVNRQQIEHPLSSAQQRLWFIQQLNPQDASYNMSSFLQLQQRGEHRLNTDALAQALRALVERHMSLRTTFIRQGESVYQQVNPVPAKLLNCHQIDAEADDIDSLMQFATQAAATPFNLSRDMMLKANLYNNKLLQLTIHHIAADGWSMGILIRELAALYHHFSHHDSQGDSNHSPLAPLPVQYIDYAHWQQQQLTGKRAQQLNQFWQQNMANAPTLMSLPLDNPRPEIATSDGGRVACQLPHAQLKALTSLAAQQRCTTYMAMLALFDLLMHQWTGKTDIVIGTDLANREQPELENLIGFFVNLLPTRLDLSGNPSFNQLLQRARTQCLEVYQHQDMPFDKIVELVNPERSQSHHPLVQVLLVLQNAPKTQLSSDTIDIEVLTPDNQSTRFDLGLFLDESNDGLNAGLNGYWSYNSNLFNQATIDKLNQQLSQLMTQVCAQPDAPISQFKAANDKPQNSRRKRLAGLKRA